MIRTVDASSDLSGQPLTEAVETVVAGSDRDEKTVQTTLERVASDGVVSVEAFEDTVSEVSKVVSTAETRTELARIALTDAQEAAADVLELDIVRVRLASFENDVDAVEGALADLQADLRGFLDRDSDRVTYDAVRDLRSIRATATDVQGWADEIQVDLEDFERWLGSPTHRVHILSQHVDDLETAVETLAATAADLSETADDGVAWANATIQHAALTLFVADLRSELHTVRTWPGREETAPAGDVPEWDDISARITALEDRLISIETTLEDTRKPAWRERYGDAVRATEQALDGVEPPVDWAEVEATVNEHRPPDTKT